MINYQTILDLCEKKGVKVTNVEKELGISKGALKKVEKSTPNADRIYALAKYFDVPMEIFFSDEDKVVAHYYESLKDQYAEVNMEGFSPVFDAAAGNGRISGDYAEEMIEEEVEEEYVWLKIYGDSMYPILQNGDCVKVHLQTETEKTDLTVIKVDGETTTVKYVEVMDNGVWLRAENKDVYEDTFYTAREIMTLPVTIVGRAVELKRSF